MKGYIVKKTVLDNNNSCHYVQRLSSLLSNYCSLNHLTQVQEIKINRFQETNSFHHYKISDDYEVIRDVPKEELVLHIMSPMRMKNYIANNNLNFEEVVNIAVEKGYTCKIAYLFKHFSKNRNSFLEKYKNDLDILHIKAWVIAHPQDIVFFLDSIKLIPFDVYDPFYAKKTLVRNSSVNGLNDIVKQTNITIYNFLLSYPKYYDNFIEIFTHEKMSIMWHLYLQKRPDDFDKFDFSKAENMALERVSKIIPEKRKFLRQYVKVNYVSKWLESYPDDCTFFIKKVDDKNVLSKLGKMFPDFKALINLKIEKLN